MDFREAFERKLHEHNPDYRVRGVVTADRKVYPIGSDTKVLSTIFELIARPTVYAVARDEQLIVREAEQQNYYPDFTLMRGDDDRHKVAVDVKTTYWRVGRGGERYAAFTLGSYTSFLLSDTKNIVYPYSHYGEHWVIGFVYARPQLAQEVAHVYRIEDLDAIPIPYEAEISVFVQEKWRIASDRPGSGNTANIGSIRGPLRDFQQGAGPFASEEEFTAYWRQYPRGLRQGRRSLTEFRAAVGRSGQPGARHQGPRE